MVLEVLKNIKSYKELSNYLAMMNEMAKDNDELVNTLYRVEDKTEFPELTYFATSVTKDMVVKHWFKYCENNLYGLVSCNTSDFKLHKVTDARYLDTFESVAGSSEIWLCSKQDAMNDLVITDKVAIENLTSYDVLDIGYLNMLQINFVDGIGLICFQKDIGASSIYVPKDVKDFEDWYFRKCKADAYQGYMSNVSAQDLFRIEFEVENTIFNLDNYKVIQLNK